MVVRLIDVAPDGRGPHHQGRPQPHAPRLPRGPEPVEPGTPINVESRRRHVVGLRGGPSMRVAVNGADYPNAWPSPFHYDGTIHLGGDGGSCLRMPVLGPSEASLPSPRSAPSATPPIGEVLERDRAPGVARDSRPHYGGDRGPCWHRIHYNGQRWPHGSLQLAMGLPVSPPVTPPPPMRSLADQPRSPCPTRADDRGPDPWRDQSDEDAFHVTIELVVSIDDQPFRTVAWSRSYERNLL